MSNILVDIILHLNLNLHDLFDGFWLVDTGDQNQVMNTRRVLFNHFNMT